MPSSVKAPEKLELWIESSEGIVTHISGGQFEGAEGVSLAYEDAGTQFSITQEAQFNTIYQSAAFQVGGTYTGTTEEMFEFKLMFNIKGGDNFSYRQAYSRFRNGLATDKDAYLHARIQGVSHRKLAIRLQKSSNFKNSVDPNGMQFGQVMMSFVGAYPRWVEVDWSDEWVTNVDTTYAGTNPPSASAPTTATTGGTLAAATYYYVVTALVAGGETAASNEVSKATTGTTSTITLSWSAVTGATGYKVYRSTTAGTEHLLTTLGTGTSFTDTGSLTPDSSKPFPTSSTVPQIDTGYVTVWNPTNTTCWVRWMAQAGNANVEWTIPDFSWGSDAWNRASQDAGRMIIMPELLLGEHIAIDTNPYSFSGQVTSSLDTQVYLRMNGVQFLYPLPPRTPPTDIPVQVSLAQPGNGIKVYCPMEWLHPWGGE